MARRGREFPVKGPDGVLRWSDGTEVTMIEQAIVNMMLADVGPDQVSAFIDKTKAAGGDVGVFDPSKSENYQDQDILTGAFSLMSLLPEVATPESPGAELDIGKQSEEHIRLQKLLGDLQQQATTGGGAWEESLKKATEQASASAMALGQSAQTQGGGSVMGALGDIGNARAAARQRGAGQAEILRAKSKLSAQDQISGLTSGLGQTATEQAVAQAAARRQVKQANQAAIDRAQETAGNMATAGTSFLGSGGGTVPGRSEKSGDNTDNDTVPAWLSPGEIVLPRSVTAGADAPARAAEFVRALQAREGGDHAGGFADGGEVDDGGPHQTTTDEYGMANVPLSVFLPHAGQALGYGRLRDKYARPGAPSVEGGGLLETRPYDYARQAQLQNAALLEQRARGLGPSVVPQMMQNTSDANIGAALAARAAGGRQAGAGEALQRATAAQQDAAGQAAGMTAQEQMAGQHGASQALLDQQARDNAFAIAQQQAAWQNTLTNMGLGIQQQQQLQSIFGAAGQGLAAASSLDFDDKPSGEPIEGGGSTYKLGEDDDAEGKAHGGRVKDKRAEEFVRALSRGGYCR